MNFGIANGIFTDEIIWTSLKSHRHHDGTVVLNSVFDSKVESISVQSGVMFLHCFNKKVS